MTRLAYHPATGTNQAAGPEIWSQSIGNILTLENDKCMDFEILNWELKMIVGNVIYMLH